jgi:hypothetical protein
MVAGTGNILTIDSVPCGKSPIPLLLKGTTSEVSPPGVSPEVSPPGVSPEDSAESILHDSTYDEDMDIPK